jgi:hypothetical protein
MSRGDCCGCVFLVGHFCELKKEDVGEIGLPRCDEFKYRYAKSY